MSHKDYKENQNTSEDNGYVQSEPEKDSYAPLKIVLSVIVGLGIDYFFLATIRQGVWFGSHITIGLCALVLYKELKKK